LLASDLFIWISLVFLPDISDIHRKSALNLFIHFTAVKKHSYRIIFLIKVVEILLIARKSLVPEPAHRSQKPKIRTFV
jgi:hypothetical protein